MPQYDYVSVEVEGNAIDAWQSYTVESDIFTPADAFSLVLGVGGAVSKTVRRNIDYLRSAFQPGSEVKLYCGHGETRALQMVGVVDAVDVRNDATGGTTFNVQGRDRARYLVDNDMPLDLYGKDDTIQSIATKAVERFGISVRGDATLNRQVMAGGISQKKLRAIQQQAAAKGIPAALLSDKIAASIERGKLSLDGLARAVNTKSVNALELYQIRIQDAKPRVGESIWDFLSRHAQRNGALLRMTCDGNLMLMGVDDEQDPTTTLIRSIEDGGENNIVSGGERFDLAQSYSRVEVYGWSKKKNGAARSKYQGVAEDKSLDASRSYRLGVIRDNSIRTEKDAQKRAEYELALSRQGAHVVEYTLRGHGTGKAVYAVDTVYDVADDVTSAFGHYYVTSRTLSLSEGTGPVTQVRAVPKGSIVMLGDT